MIRAYWFFGDTLRDGQPVPPDGEWLEHDGPLVLCDAGLHASRDPFDALQYAPGPNLALVDLDGEIIEGGGKVVASRRRIVKRIDATGLLRSFARAEALSVIHLWDAPPIVREYLESGDESKREAARAAAWAAAGEAARAAAGAAAWEAAGEVAWEVAWEASRSRFNALVKEALG